MPSEMTMVEKVARALCRAMNVNPDGFNDANKFHSAQEITKYGQMWTFRNWQAAESMARAAIAAMSPATPQMVEAANEADTESPSGYTYIWARMISAALQEPTP